MSMEKVSYQQLAVLAAAKVVGDTFGMASRVARGISVGLEEIADAAFVFEFDAAKRYENLTGTDLGVAIGEPTRYASDADAELSEVEEDDE